MSKRTKSGKLSGIAVATPSIAEDAPIAKLTQEEKKAQKSVSNVKKFKQKADEKEAQLAAKQRLNAVKQEEQEMKISIKFRNIYIEEPCLALLCPVLSIPLTFPCSALPCVALSLPCLVWSCPTSASMLLWRRAAY
jgi:hypothetical protein